MNKPVAIKIQMNDGRAFLFQGSEADHYIERDNPDGTASVVVMKGDAVVQELRKADVKLVTAEFPSES